MARTAAAIPWYPFTWLAAPCAACMLEYPPRYMYDGFANQPTTATRYGPDAGTRSGSGGRAVPSPRGVAAFFSSTMLSPATRLAIASRSGVWVTARLASLL